MSDDKDKDNAIVARPSHKTDLQVFETGLMKFVQQQGLPSDGVLVGVPERVKVFNNVPDVLDKLTSLQRSSSIYISKFIAAAASGLFDAALNYLWDQTIQELRRRVAQYDLGYFFDVAVKNPDKKKKLKTAEDLPKIDDSELVNGANEIELISDVGYKHLDYIRYMRNWASAAHPNQNEISGLQLISWLETCIIEVINLPESTVVVEIKKLLTNIKANSISAQEAKSISVFFTELTQARVDNLAAGFFGIFCNSESTEQTRQNVRFLVPKLWPRVSEDARNAFGVKYAQYVANNDVPEQKFAREFFDVVGGASYIPDGIRVAEIDSAIQSLLAAHHGMNNFYTEPGAVKQLADLVENGNDVPAAIAKDYVLAVVRVFLSNGNGIAWNAEPTYSALLNAMGAELALRALLSFTDDGIASRLQHSLSSKKFQELLTLVKPKLSAPAAVELVQAIEAFRGPLHNMRNDSTIKSRVQNLKALLNL